MEQLSNTQDFCYIEFYIY